jgi:hypothetical protein
MHLPLKLGGSLSGLISLFAALAFLAPSSAAASQSYVQNGHIYVNGKAVFPFGFYHVSFYGTAAQKLTDTQTMATTGFNSIDPSLETTDASYLSSAATAGINVLPQFDGDPLTLVNDFKGSSAIMGWAIVDDANNGAKTPAQISALNASVKAADPNHITYISVGGGGNYSNYLNLSDVVGVQIYPIGCNGSGPSPIGIENSMLAPLVAEATPLGTPVIANVQCSSVYSGIVPTAQEVRNMTYQAIINGVQGILYYTYYDGGFYMVNEPSLWAGMELLPAEIDTLTPIMTSTAPVKVSTGNANTLCAYWTYNSQVYVVVISTDYSGPDTVSIQLPSAITGSGEALFPNRPKGLVLQSGNVLTGSVNSLDVHAYVFNTGNPLPPPPPPPPVSSLPSPWVNQDIGSVGSAGSASYSNGVFTANGSGADIWGTADAFQYVYQPLTGNGEIVAQVTAIQNTNTWAKAGVMIRNTLDAGSAMATMVVSSSSGSAFQYRSTAGASPASTTGSNVTAPYWVKLARQGNSFFAFTSPDGATWTSVGSPQTIDMNTNAYVGLCVTAHDNSAVCSSTFSNVSVSSLTPPAVALANPVDGASFTAPATLSLAALASSADSTIVQVQFYNGATLLGSAAASPYQYSWSGVAAGSYQLSAVASDAFGLTATSTVVNVTVANTPNGGGNPPPPPDVPTVTSPLADQSSAVAGQAVTMSVAATDPNGDTLTYTWDLGDGTIASGPSVVHTYASAGIYAVTVTISNGANSTIVTGVVVVSAAVSPTPTPKLPTPFNLLKSSIKFSFKKNKADSLDFMGTLPLGAGFSPNKESLNVNIGGYSSALSLNAKGKGANATDSFALAGAMKSGKFTTSPVKFKYTVARQNLFSSLQTLGFANATVKAQTINVPISMTIGGNKYAANASLTYAAKQDQEGLAK